MGLRRVLFAPLYRIADWADSNPLSAVGAIIALGALAMLLVSMSLSLEATGAELTTEAETAILLAELAAERPAYLVTAGVGLAVVLFYDG